MFVLANRKTVEHCCRYYWRIVRNPHRLLRLNPRYHTDTPPSGGRYLGRNYDDYYGRKRAHKRIRHHNRPRIRTPHYIVPRPRPIAGLPPTLMPRLELNLLSSSSSTYTMQLFILFVNNRIGFYVLFVAMVLVFYLYYCCLISYSPREVMQ